MMTFSLRATTRLAVVTVVSIAMASVLAACSDDSTEGEGGSDAAKQFTLQTSWIPSVQFSGSYIADADGYYADEGLDVEILPGGPDVDPLAVVAAGQADIGLSNADFVARANAEGADLVIVAAGFQKNPFAFLSSPDAPIETPDDLVGSKIGVPGGDDAIVNAFLGVNDIAEGEVTKVPVGFDVAPLVSGEVDGLVAFYTEQPPTYKDATGKDGVTLLMGDYGLDVYAQVYAVRRDSLDDPDSREAIENFLRAEIKGWNAYVDDVAHAVDLTVNDYAADGGLSADLQTASANLQLDLLISPDTEENGLLWISDEGIEKNLATIEALGVEGADDSIFDTSILNEVAN
jgi:ABC-type nitrate/sulfonate/bicarbonate transport system substrate-binding protein